MPVISISMGKIPSETKKILVSAITATASTVTKIPPEHFIVFINEFSDDAIGVGGKVLQEVQGA